MKENTMVEISAWLSVVLIALLIGCSIQRTYYPIVSERSGEWVTVQIERKNDRIEISFPDSILQVGDTVQFTKGNTPIDLRIIDTYGDYQSYIIRP